MSVGATNFVILKQNSIMMNFVVKHLVVLQIAITAKIIKGASSIHISFYIQEVKTMRHLNTLVRK